MASIVKRRNRYSVVYTYTDELGEKKQKWETFNTNAEAKKRKLQVEYEQETGSFIVIRQIKRCFIRQIKTGTFWDWLVM